MNTYVQFRDEQLVVLTGQGDTVAFDELYGRYNQRLYSFFLRMYNGCTEKASDSLQEIFLKIIERPGMFDPERSFSSWIFSIAYNMCKNDYKHEAVRINVHKEIRQEGRDRGLFCFQQATDKLDRKIFRQRLEEELLLLSEEKRCAFILKYQEHKSIREIAQIQECSEGTVKSRIFYASQHLARQLAAFNPKT
jgi:RNA polymerase sigma-70 factor (ECF subfamily)